MSEKPQYGDHVHLLADAFYIPQLERYRKIQLYLPKDYHKSEKRYPVIYMHDGQHLFHTQPPRNDEWAVDSVADELIRSGLKEMIIIGIDHAEKNRFNEYSPFDGDQGKGEGKAYADFIVKTLKPFVDSNYRTLPDAKNTAIAGGSMGGLISMYILATYPEIFGSAGIFSPSFWYAPSIFNYVEENLPKLGDHKIYLVIGGKEGEIMINDVKRMHTLITSTGNNKQVVLSEVADGRHKEWFWHREFAGFYQFLNN